MVLNPQVAKAFRAMRCIGIREEKVKPVLKSLLKLYEKNWELIETENYRVLADAIFESEEMEAKEDKKKLENPDRQKEAQVHDELDNPSKRSGSKHQNDLASSSLANSSPSLDDTRFKKPKVEAAEVDETPPSPLVRNKGVQPVSPKSLLTPERSLSSQPAAANGTHPDATSRTKADSNSSFMHLRDKGKAPLLPEVIEPRVISGRSSQGVCIREPKDDSSFSPLPKQKVPGNSALFKPKDRTITDDVPQFKVAIPVVQPEPPPQENSSIGIISSRDTDGNELVQPSCIDESDISDGIQASTIDKSLTSELVSVPVSSPSEAVKILQSSEAVNLSLSCNSSLGNKCASIVAVDRGMPVQTFHYVSDLDKGQESFAISLENKINNDCPPSFHYMDQNVVFRSASVKFSLTRIGDSCCATCQGNCLLSSKPCACLGGTSGGHVYTPQGLVKEKILEEYISMNRNLQKNCLLSGKECSCNRSKTEEKLESCKGQIARKFIKECRWKCGCSKQCGNRVVQRGINCKLQVFMTSDGKGWGLRTVEDLPKGAFVCEYVGEVLTRAELSLRVSKSPSDESPAYHVLLDAGWGEEGALNDTDTLCLDATHYGNVARFINHRCFDPSLVEIPVEMETPDHHYYHLAFFTTRNVKALEELTWDYGINFGDQDLRMKAFECKCGSKFCRGINSSSRSGTAATMG